VNARLYAFLNKYMLEYLLLILSNGTLSMNITGVVTDVLLSVDLPVEPIPQTLMVYVGGEPSPAMLNGTTLLVPILEPPANVSISYVPKVLGEPPMYSIRIIRGNLTVMVDEGVLVIPPPDTVLINVTEINGTRYLMFRVASPGELNFTILPSIPTPTQKQQVANKSITPVNETNKTTGATQRNATIRAETNETAAKPKEEAEAGKPSSSKPIAPTPAEVNKTEERQVAGNETVIEGRPMGEAGAGGGATIPPLLIAVPIVAAVAIAATLALRRTRRVTQALSDVDAAILDLLRKWGGGFRSGYS